MPKLLVEKSIHTIRSRRLCWSHFKHRYLDFISSKITRQCLLHIWGHLMLHRVKTIISLSTSTCIKQVFKIIYCHLRNIFHLLHPISVRIFYTMYIISLPSLCCFRVKKFCILISMLKPRNSTSLCPKYLLFQQ